MNDLPLLTKEDEKRMEKITVETVHRLDVVARAHGHGAMIAESFGLMYGVAHVFKALGLRHRRRFA
jgi:hypothetical protein